MKERLDVNFYINTVDFSGLSYGTKSLHSLSNDIFQGVTIRTGLPSDPIALKVKNILGDDSIDFLNIEHTCNVPEQKLLKVGDIITPFIGEAVRLIKFSVFNGEPNKYTIDGNVGVIRLNTNIVIPEYIQQWFQSRWGTSQILRLIGGGGVPFLGTHNAKKLLVAVPPYSIQQELVSDMQAASESRRRKLQHTEELLRGIDTYLLETLGLTPPPAETRKVFAVRLRQLQGKRIDAPAYQPLFATGHAPNIPLNSLSELAFIDTHVADKPKSEEYPVPYIGLPECSQTEIKEVVMRSYLEVKGRSVVKPGDILFARIEPSIFNKKYVLVEDLKDYEYAYTSTEFYVVTPNPDVVDPYYLYAMFFCAFVFNQVQGKTTGSSGCRRLSPESFRDLRIPIPSLDLQRAIAAEIRRRRDNARQLRAEAEAEWSAAKERFERSLLGD
ncbi:MAG: restriction endonuclease subunit S [Thermodesulfovibrionales bacterium]|nr:restriction endonuclease subunit S [Thermodesulfovibrionales bacterium]